jgi:hypothetical protein
MINKLGPRELLDEAEQTLPDPVDTEIQYCSPATALNTAN